MRRLKLTALLFITLILLCLTRIGWAATLTHQVTGIKKPLLNNVLARLNIQQQGIELTATSIEQLYQQAPEQIKLALQPYGYFKPHITSHLTKIDQQKWLANYTITLGPQLKITHADIKVTGPGAALFHSFLATQPLQVGKPLLTEAYNNTKKALFTIAEQSGYLDAQLSQHLIKVNLERDTAQVILHFVTGNPYYFGAIHFQKNPLSDKFLQRFVHFKYGQNYSSNDLIILQKHLNNSNFFQQALVKPERQLQKDYHIPLTITLIPRKAQQYSMGLGYGTDTGPRASIGWDWRYLTDTGHQLSSLLRLSPVQNNLQTVYVIPGDNPITDQYNISGSLLRNQLPRGENIMTKLGVASITRIHGWTQTIALNKQIERYRFSEQTHYSDSTLLIPSITWQYTQADQTLYPLKGYRINFNIQGASKALLSDTSLIQLSLNGKYIHRIADKGRVLLRTDLGYTTIQDPNSQLPLSLSFFAGGARSVRGYGYQALGPGRYLVTGSIEYQYQIIKNWNAAIFFDAGNAFRKMPSTQKLFNSLQQAIGIGAVWISPIGPINLSLAKAINWPGQPMQIQLSMGPDL